MLRPRVYSVMVNYVQFLTPLRATSPVTAILIMSLLQHYLFDRSQSTRNRTSQSYSKLPA